MRELNLEQGNSLGKALNLIEAIDLAADQSQGTWLLLDGKRVAAIVPVEVAEAAEEALADLLAEPGPRPDADVADNLLAAISQRVAVFIADLRRQGFGVTERDGTITITLTEGEKRS